MQVRLEKILHLLTSSLIIMTLAACANSPTGQNQLKLFPDSEITRMGINSYEEMKTRIPINTDARLNNYVRCVASAITAELPGNTSWEVTVFEDEAVNAFALPGGKIGVYTGLLSVADGQDQLAAVIGHEVAHVSAEHGNARISAAYASQTGLQVLQALSGGGNTPQKAQLWGLLGLGIQAGVLMPYGRGQESEADIIGLEYMAKAGFAPGASVLLWQNMSRNSGEQPPEFMSTHPSHQTRINDLKAAMPGAQQLFNQAVARGQRPHCD